MAHMFADVPSPERQLAAAFLSSANPSELPDNATEHARDKPSSSPLLDFFQDASNKPAAALRRGRRQVASAAFLLLEDKPKIAWAEHSWPSVPERRRQGCPATFSDHGHEHDSGSTAAVAGAMEQDLEKLATDPSQLADMNFWVKALTDAAMVANTAALALTFLGALYHAYGYSQLRGAQKQAQANRHARPGQQGQGHH